KVVPQGKVQHKSVFLAVLRYIRDAFLCSFSNGFVRNILSIENNLAGRNFHQAGNRVRQFHLAVSGYACNSENFAPVYFKGNIFYYFKTILVVYAYIFHFQYSLTETGSAFLDVKGNFAAHHQV